MKIVVNGCYGGYSVPEEYERCKRTDAKLIAYVESGAIDNEKFYHTKLFVVDIPDNATDFQIWEYDGMETVIYVVDGKIHRA